MRSSNNIKNIDLDAESAQGNVFWIVYDMDTQETLTAVDVDDYTWKPITLSTGDNWGLSEIEETARFSSYEDAEEVAQFGAAMLMKEYPGEDINLEIHRVRLELVEMVQDIDPEAGVVKRAGAEESDDDDEDDWDVTSDDGLDDDDEDCCIATDHDMGDEDDADPPGSHYSRPVRYSGFLPDVAANAEKLHKKQKTSKKKKKTTKSR